MSAHKQLEANYSLLKRRDKELQTLLKIYEFILSKNKEMLRAINKERRKNDEYKEQLPILIERLQYLSEACIKKEELIKTQGEYMQTSENEIYELQIECRQKDALIRELNKTIIEQRDYLEKHTHDNSFSAGSFDSKLDASTTSKRRRRNNTHQSQSQRDEDFETIEGLKDDIKQLLKEYKLVERQKDDLETKYHDQCKKNDELVREILNMEKVIEDQDTQIVGMRDKLQSQLKEMTHSQAYVQHINMLKEQLNPALDYTDTDLNKSANISQQIALDNFKAGKIGPRNLKPARVSRRALKNALNLSYQIINNEGDRKEQSFIEEKIALRKARGMSPFGVTHDLNPLMPRNREANNTDSTAEGDSKGDPAKKLLGLGRLHSTGRSAADA